MNLTQGVRSETSDLLASRTLSQIPSIYILSFLSFLKEIISPVDCVLFLDNFYYFARRQNHRFFVTFRT